VTDEERAFVVPYLMLPREDSGSRHPRLRAVFDTFLPYFLRSDRPTNALAARPRITQ
jgi:hypothetical protein